MKKKPSTRKESAKLALKKLLLAPEPRTENLVPPRVTAKYRRAKRP